MMTSEISFTENVLKAFKDIIREIEKGSSEHDIRYRFVKYFLEGCLSYEPRYIKWEKKRADLTIIDENNFAVIKIETKRPTENIDRPDYEEQAFKYEEETTRYIGLTNFLRFKLWEVKKTGRELKVDLDFSKILEQRKPAERLSTEEKTQILFLNNLTKETLFDPSKYEKFDETYGRIDITKERGFKKLLERLNFIADNLLFGYTLKAFGEYKEGYNKYRVELDKVDSELNDKNNNRELKHNIVRYRQKIENEYKKYTSFGGFELWKYYSGKESVPDDDVKEVFCKESIYVLLNKLLFIRICEDKGLLPKNLSNGGIEILRQRTIHEETAYKEILKFAFDIASGLYAHFYETGILDWFRTGDGELNELLNRVLWILNQFDFTHVDRDILGNLYEKYLPSAERKKLGEFYTPVEVIDYILTSVGYTYSHDIETKDILDPACGSGGFLVRATRRLISRYLMKFGKANKRELRDPKNWKEIVGRLTPDEAKIILDAIQEHIYGLDINPFACHIAEMNMLFQIIDLYQKAREKHKDYKLGRFKIYRTDSLEKPAQKQIWDYGHQAFLEEQDEIDEIKKKKFDFVVGNPPYVRIHMISQKDKELYSKSYQSATGIYDLFVLFVERGIKWLKSDGKIGYIMSNKFTHSSYGKGLRELITSHTSIERIIDFGDSGVFKDATNYPLIFIARKYPPQNNVFPFVKVKKPKDGLIQHIFKYINKEEFSDDYIDVFYVKQDTLSGEPWELISEKEKKILSKWYSKARTLGDMAYIRLGIFTALDKAFVISEEEIKKYSLSKQLIKPLLQGKDVRRWKINWNKKYIIYPYVKKDGKLKPVDLSKYPTVKNYLNQFKDELTRRAWLRKLNQSEKESRWYEYADSGNPELFKGTKIVTPDISTKNNFALDENGYFVLKTCYIITPKNNGYDLKLLLGILNSSLTEFIFKKISPFISGGYYRYMKNYMERLPIKLPETAKEKQIANQIIKKVDKILELHKKAGILDIEEILKGQETQKLYSLPSVSFSIKDNAKFENIEVKASKIFINSGDYVQIKDKKIRDFVAIYLNSVEERLSKAKDVKGIIYNIVVPKSEEVLKEIIKKGSFDQADVRDQIKKLEQEINELVYEIYGVTSEERRIIEESLR